MGVGEEGMGEEGYFAALLLLLLLPLGLLPLPHCMRKLRSPASTPDAAAAPEEGRALAGGGTGTGRLVSVPVPLLLVSDDLPDRDLSDPEPSGVCEPCGVCGVASDKSCP